MMADCAARMVSHMCDLHDGRYTVQYIALVMTAACMMYAHLYTLHVVVVATGAEAAVAVMAGCELPANGSRFPVYGQLHSKAAHSNAWPSDVPVTSASVSKAST